MLRLKLLMTSNKLTVMFCRKVQSYITGNIYSLTFGRVSLLWGAICCLRVFAMSAVLAAYAAIFEQLFE